MHRYLKPSQTPGLLQFGFSSYVSPFLVSGPLIFPPDFSIFQDGLSFDDTHLSPDIHFWFD